jgi:hypothetical protein
MITIAEIFSKGRTYQIIGIEVPERVFVFH